MIIQKSALSCTGDPLRIRCAGEPAGGADGVSRDAEARVTAPDTVPGMAQDVSRPRWVRYAWYSFGPAGLYGGTGLAAAPLEQETED